MENEAVIEEKIELSKEEKELQRKKQNNIKIYPIYRIFSWDLLFYYAIIYLFLTVQKKITPAQVLQFDAFYLLAKLLTQIPCTLFIQKFGKRNSLVVANLLGAIHVLFIIFAPNFNILLLSQLLCAFSFTIKATCDTDMLYDSLEHNEKRGSIFSKIDGKAMSRFYYVDAISAILAGFLYVVNPYIPMVICFLTFILTFVLSVKFEEIHNERGRMHVREEIKNIRYGFRNIMKSSRLKNLLLFNAMFVGIVKIMSNIRNTVLVEVGLPEQYFGIVFAIMGITLGISTRFQGKIHEHYRNKTLTALVTPMILSYILMGFVMLSGFKQEISIVMVVLLLLVQCIVRGPYFVLIKRYFNNFTDSEKRVKISTANNLCENAIASVLVYIASFILEFLKIQYTCIVVGFIFLIIFTLLLDSMRKTVGLKPEEYSKKEIL